VGTSLLRSLATHSHSEQDSQCFAFPRPGIRRQWDGRVVSFETTIAAVCLSAPEAGGARVSVAPVEEPSRSISVDLEPGCVLTACTANAERAAHTEEWSLGLQCECVRR
jgi:hypothetical protein